ncbi:MAG: hypothetical protein ACRD2W_09880 [Acidimicrobiales bacterium]
MAAAEPDYVEFSAGETSAVLPVMAEMAESHRGWINFEPAVHVEDVPPPRSGLFSLFSTRGPDVPLATWSPGEARKNRPEPAMVGILHPAGPQAKVKLADRGRPVPDGWVVMQDHSKKGLVVAVPPTVPHAEVVEWLLRATTALSLIPVTGTWRAAIHPG